MSEDEERSAGQLREEAAWWFAHMRGPQADQDRAAFEQWLARGALHRAAYNRVAERFAEGKHLKDYYRTERRRRLVKIGAGAALLVSLYPALTLLTKGGSHPITAPRGMYDRGQFVTVVGQVRSIKLADGSRILLDSDSLVAVRFDAQRRVIDLRRGRARFDVAHETRPFSVTANAIEVTATGTVFDVSLTNRNVVDVHLIRGTVGVARRAANDAASPQPPIILHAGQSARLSDNGRLARSAAQSDDIAWPALRLEFDRTRLADVVERSNRNSLETIVVPDPAIANLRVSGTFRADDAGILAERLAALFDLEIDRRTSGVIALRARQKNNSPTP